MWTTTIAALLATLPAAGSADLPERRCIRAGDIPAELRGWTERTSLVAAVRMDRARPVLAVARAATVTLSPSAAIRFEVAPGKNAPAGSFGGMASVMIDRPGTYRVALGAGAWLDVVRAGAAVASTAHAHGPACTDVRKLVDFALTPGRYTLQLSGALSPTIAMEVVRVP